MKILSSVGVTCIGLISTLGALNATLAFAGVCKLPSGEVFFELSKADQANQNTIIIGGETRPMTEQEKKTYRIRTFVKPSLNCKGVRIWQTMGGASSMPTDAQCMRLAGDFSPYPDFLGCHDFKIYKNKTEAEKTQNPAAYLGSDGTLVTMNASGSGFGVINGKYKLTGGKIKGTFNFEKFSQSDDSKIAAQAIIDWTKAFFETQEGKWIAELTMQKQGSFGAYDKYLGEKNTTQDCPLCALAEKDSELAK